MSAAEKFIEALEKTVPQVPHGVGETYRELCRIFPLHKIETAEQNEAVLGFLASLGGMVAELSVGPFRDDVLKYMEALSILVESYESAALPKSKPVPAREMLQYLMELQGLKQSDLAKELGGQPVVSAILSGKRSLNVGQIKALAKRFKVSPAVFLER